MTELNPRQFASLDASDAGLHGSLTNRPASGVSATQPIDLAVHWDIERQLADYQKQNGTFKPRTGPGEIALEAERQAEINAAWRESVKQSKAAQEIQAQRNQAQRTELLNRIKGEQGTPHPYETESDRNRIRRMNNLPPINEPPVSTPQRQPPPSTGRPPPTPSGTAARASALVEPTATPAPAITQEAIPPAPTGGGIASLPRSLPTAAGRLVVPGIIAGLDFGNRVVHGQSVTQAATGAGASLVGGVVGGIAGSAIAGPVGGLVGSIIGGYIGGAIADSFFHNPPSTGNPPTEVPNYPPFRGGQSPGVMYTVTCGFDVYQKGNPRQLAANADGTTIAVRGPIQFIGLINDSPQYNPGLLVIGTNEDDSPQIKTAGYGSYRITEVDHLRNVSVRRGDGANEIYPDKTTPAPPPDNEPYRYNTSPIGSNNTVPSGTPSAGKKKGKDKNVAPSMPGNNTPNGAAFFPGHGGLAPSHLPNPTQTPSNLGGQLPATEQPPPPLPFVEPGDIPAPRTITFNTSSGSVTSSQGNSVPLGAPTFPGSTVKYDAQGNVLPTGIDGKDPYSFKPNPLVANPLVANGLQPSGLPTTTAPNPISDAQSSVPKSNTAPKPETTSQAETRKQSDNNEQTKKAIEQEVKKLTELGALIAGLTPIIKGIPDAIAHSPTVQAANRATTQGAVCEIAQPGGCLGNALDNSADKVNQNNNQNTNNLLDAVNTGANAALLQGQQTILARLGAQLPGGIGGKLSRFADWMHLDRVLNLMILGATIHNALMLSNDIGQTLIGAINNILQVIGLKKEDGSAFDIGSVISSSIENLIKEAIGTDNYVELKETWAKANRIYQATNNVLNSFLNLSQTILQASELIAAYTGKIGNALKKGGVILENAYGWMNPQPKFNRVTQLLEGLQNGASTIQMVTQAPLDIVNATTDLTIASTEFVKAVKEDDKEKNKVTPTPEPDELKSKEQTGKTNSQPFSFDFSDLFDGED